MRWAAAYLLQAVLPPLISSFIVPIAPGATRPHALSAVDERTALAKDIERLASQVEELSQLLRLSVAPTVAANALSAAALDVAAKAPPPAAAAKPAAAAADLPPFVAGATVTSLEATPYYDQSGIPLHLYKNREPYDGTVVSVERCVGERATGDVAHIVVRHDGKIPYWEGQSMGITPPGTGPDGKPHKVRLYSICSTRYGDDGAGDTVSFCVRRAAYIDPVTNKEDPTKAGVCSNFLHAAKAGDKVQLTGPVGKILLLPEATPAADLIMVGTGTGVAPYRAFVRRLFQEDTPAARAFTGVAWLFLGVANRDSLLYHDDFQRVVRRFPFNFRYDVALSREQKNRAGGKLYIQDLMEEHADELFNRLDAGAHIYFCGLKGMMPPIQAMLARVASEKGVDWDVRLAELKKRGQWHVEVY